MLTLVGRIIGVGFSSGDRVVVGQWDRSPIGPFADVMWADANDQRTLFTDTDRAADFITSIYHFEQVRVVDLGVERRRRHLTVHLPRRSLTVQAHRAIPVLGPRPRWFTRFVEKPLARRLLGVETHGVSPAGVEEWYQARWWAPLRSAEATVDGRSLGSLGVLDPPARFGFSEAPRRPSWTELRTVVDLPMPVSPDGEPRPLTPADRAGPRARR